MKKCQQSVNDHKTYVNKYNEFNDWITQAEDKLDKCLNSMSSTTVQSEWTANLNNLKGLLEQRPQAVPLLSSVVELGEKLYNTTAADGRDVIRGQLEDAQTRMDKLFDRAIETERDVQTKLSRYWGRLKEIVQLMAYIKIIFSFLVGVVLNNVYSIFKSGCKKSKPRYQTNYSSSRLLMRKELSC